MRDCGGARHTRRLGRIQIELTGTDNTDSLLLPIGHGFHYAELRRVLGVDWAMAEEILHVYSDRARRRCDVDSGGV
jgi:hypothetical protein